MDDAHRLQAHGDDAQEQLQRVLGVAHGLDGPVVGIVDDAADVGGMVGGVDHAHVLSLMPLPHGAGQAGGVGSGGKAQFVGEGLNAVVVGFALLAHAAVGADGDRSRSGSRQGSCQVGEH